MEFYDIGESANPECVRAVARLRECLRVHECLCSCVRVCVCACVCKCKCMTERKREREGEREREREGERSCQVVANKAKMIPLPGVFKNSACPVIFRADH